MNKITFLSKFSSFSPPFLPPSLIPNLLPSSIASPTSTSNPSPSSPPRGAGTNYRHHRHFRRLPPFTNSSLKSRCHYRHCYCSLSHLGPLLPLPQPPPFPLNIVCSEPHYRSGIHIKMEKKNPSQK